MSDVNQSDKDLLHEIIEYVEGLLTTCNGDLHQLNSIAVQMRAAKQAGRISDMNYTIDHERLQRTMNKCKQIIMTLLTQRKRALMMLKELPA